MNVKRIWQRAATTHTTAANSLRSASATAALLAAASLAACGSDGRGSGASETTSTAAPAPVTAAGDAEEAARVVRSHLAAVSDDDLDAYLAAVRDDARFDIGGRAVEGREAIGEFFRSELSGGRYEVLRDRPSSGGVTLELDFRRGDLYEQLTYAYTVSGGRIVQLVARYR